jgi:hypothetical protein
MRPLLRTVIAAALLLSAPVAHGAPTCQSRDGDTMKCGAPGAMPVGWVLSPRAPSKPMDMGELVSLVCILCGLFGLISAMPDFDGTAPGDWDRQEGDDIEDG